MRSELPKVLAPLAGRPLLRYVVDALRAAGVKEIVLVVGYRADLVEQEFAGERDIHYAMQSEQLGTGHAVMMCRPQLERHRGPVAVVTGDSPMLQPSSLRTLLEAQARQQAACVLGTVFRDDPTGWGRIVRDASGEFAGIVEEKDATAAQRAIREVNPSTYVFDANELRRVLDELQNSNSQGEYYITDAPAILLAAGKKVLALDALQPCESLSINSPEDLQAVERAMRQR
jgi:bifunctional UDP-N-acetylglucosamine pyrophosphorylase/glucosamine-1-phosphate N-acetyltransferase/UDP-N-acetylglucosamine pyrophosphorylase